MLPPGLRSAMDAMLEGVSRSDLARRAARISEHYRAGLGSAGAIRDGLDALAYAVVRLPATYAAAREALQRTAAALPAFAPESLVDIGAGPGTASFAALACWPGIREITHVESNAHFRALAARLAAAGAPAGTQLRHAEGGLAAGTGPLAPGNAGAGGPDLVVASYLLVELPTGEVTALARRLAASPAQAVVLVEPGTPAGFGRIRLARDTLIAAGLHAVAPCPGDVACPMAGQDWCHFSVRLPRLRDHRLAKAADAPFEDERFSYAAFARRPEPNPRPRVLAAPAIGKAEAQLKLCTASGLEARTVQRRDKAAWKAARRLAWGDELD